MLRRTVVICIAPVLLSLFACDQGGKKGKQGAKSGGAAETETNADAKVNGDEVEGSGGGSEGSRDSVYDPTFGDSVEVERRSKQWALSSAEPTEWTESSDSLEVVGIYKSGSSCAYRVKSMVSGQAIEMDLRCEELSCGEAPKCTKESIDSIDVGDFKDASGYRQTCVSVVETPSIGGAPASRTLVKMVSDTWTHDKALREGRVVKSVSTQCSTALAADEDAGAVDACSKERKDVQMTKVEDVLVKQTEGSGENELVEQAKPQWTFSGDFKQPEKSTVMKPTCTAVGLPSFDQATMKLVTTLALSASLNRQYCDGEKAVMQSLSLSGLPGLGGSNIAVKAGSLIASSDGKNLMSKADGDCKVTIEGDKSANQIRVRGSCEKDLAPAPFPAGQTGSAGLKDISFSCDAPKDIDWDKIAPVSASAEADSENSSGNSNADSDGNGSLSESSNATSGANSPGGDNATVDSSGNPGSGGGSTSSGSSSSSGSTSSGGSSSSGSTGSSGSDPASGSDGLPGHTTTPQVPDPPANVVVSMQCSSGDYRYEQCPVPGTILTAVLTQQISKTGCGGKWGQGPNYIWVNKGCRARFSVTYAP